MSPPTHGDIFTDVINDMMGELHTLPHATSTIHSLIVNNVNSPILAEIQNLSLSKLNNSQMDSLLPALKKMTKLTSLALPRCDASPDHFKFLFADCPAFSNLQFLDLSHAQGLKSEDLFALSQSTTLNNITSLNLAHCRLGTPRAGTSRHDIVNFQSNGKKVGDWGGLVVLFFSPLLEKLTHLNISDIGIDDLLVYQCIATSPHLSNLVSLDLSGNWNDQETITALAATTTLTNLTNLNLSRAKLNDELITQLFAPTSLLPKKLRSLRLNYSSNSVSSLQVVLQGSPHLNELMLEGNLRLGSAGAALIAAHASNLTKLDLTHCKIQDEGYAALAASTALVNLRELRLSNNDAEEESIIALVNSPVMANLTHLDLTNTHLGPEVLIAIARSPAMSKLQHLILFDNQVGDQGVIALAQSATLANLTHLDLRRNQIQPEGLKALCTSPVVSKLTHLNLNANDAIGRSIAAILAAPSSNLGNLTDLSLRMVNIDDEGVLQLLATPNLDQLNVLTLANNKIDKSTKAVYWTRFDGDI